MTAAPSQTRICNAALVLLGTSRRIGALNDGTPLAVQFARVWDEAQREMQADHPWNPCLRRVDGAQSSDYVQAGSQWSYAFERPAGMLRWLPWREDHVDHFNGEEEGGFILANDSAIVIRGIFLVEDVGKWTPGMEAAMAALLAAKTAKAITGQSAMIDRMTAVYEEAVGRAKRQDGLATGQRARTAEFRSSWLAARNGGG
jgi:hypothetical protein